MPETNDTTTDRFDVVIVRFMPRDEPPEIGLTRVFGIDGAAAVKVVREVPVVVQRGVNRVRAEYFRKALVLIGAQIEVRAPDGKLVPPFGLGEAVTARPPAPAAPPAAQPLVVFSPLSLPRDPTLPAAFHAAAGRAGDARPTTGDASALPAEASPGYAGALPAAPAWGELQKPSAPTALSAALSLSALAPALPALAPAAPELATMLGQPLGPLALPDEPAQPMRAPAHPTLKEGDAAAQYVVPDVEVAGPPPTAAEAAVAPARARLAKGFRFADTNPPFLPSAPPAAAAQAPAARAVRAEPKAEPLAAAPVHNAQTAALRDAAPRRDPPAALDFDISKSIPAIEPMRAPSREELTAARRKQAILDAESGLSMPRDDGRELALLGRFEQAQARSAKESLDTPQAAAGTAHAPGFDALPAAAPPKPALRVAPIGAVAAAAPGRMTNDAQPARADGFLAGLPQATPARRPAHGVDLRSFWETIPDAIAFPFRGHGVYWIVSITVLAALVGTASAAVRMVPVLGPAAAFAMNTALLALCADYHRQCMWAVVTGEAALSHAPDFDPVRVVTTYIRSGASLSLFLLLSQLPLVFWLIHLAWGGEASALDILSSPFTWLLAVGPGFYWPMALTMASLHSDFIAVWYVHLGLRSLARAPLPYVSIVLLGGLAFLVGWALFLIVGVTSGLSGGFFAGSAGLPMAIGHGVLGALSGQLMRARPEVFE